MSLRGNPYDNAKTESFMKTLKVKTVYARLTTGERSIVGIVCLVRYNPRDREGYIFGYKDMEESMGPCESECPSRSSIF